PREAEPKLLITDAALHRVEHVAFGTDATARRVNDAHRSLVVRHGIADRFEHGPGNLADFELPALLLDHDPDFFEPGAMNRGRRAGKDFKRPAASGLAVHDLCQGLSLVGAGSLVDGVNQRAAAFMNGARPFGGLSDVQAGKINP